MQDAALFAQRVRKRLGLSQAEFSARIHVSLDTIRNWEQGTHAEYDEGAWLPSPSHPRRACPQRRRGRVSSDSAGDGQDSDCGQDATGFPVLPAQAGTSRE